LNPPWPSGEAQFPIALLTRLGQNPIPVGQGLFGGRQWHRSVSGEVEVSAGYADTIIVIVGLPDAAVKESRDRATH
jgi:hypothetical protein